MSSIIFNSDGALVAIAAETVPGGTQKVLTASITTPNNWIEAYSAVGTACNVLAGETEDILYFYGNFGTDVGLIRHTISTGGNVDISPPSIGANIINTLAVNPSQLSSGFNELVCEINGAQDVVYSDDGGATWSTWDAADGIKVNAITMSWQGVFFPHGYILGGDLASVAKVSLSPNEGASKADVTGIITGSTVCGLGLVDL